jgi:BNR/Asp-box repeat
VFVATDAAALTTAREMLPVPAAVQGDTSPRMAYDGRNLLVWTNHSGITRTGDLFRLDPAAFTVKKEETPFWGRDMYRAGPTLLMRDRMNGLSSHADFSRDDGATWTQRDDSLPTFGARFADVDNGWGVDKLSTGWSTSTATLARTTDGGKTWKPVGAPLEVSSIPLVRLSGDRVFVFTGRELLSTADAGKTWQQEWPRKE